MFTGIVEETGVIKQIQKHTERNLKMTIGAHKVLEGVTIGDSIAVNGICLTVTHATPEDFQVDVMPETIKATSLNNLEVESEINLERAMRVNGRFGGHFVSGHIDGVGVITRKEKEANAIYYDIESPKDGSELLLQKGSITVDGISLTVFDVRNNIFTISLIPHTATETTLGQKKVGEIVNIEYDMLGKYVQKLIQAEKPSNNINKELLRNNGFITE